MLEGTYSIKPNLINGLKFNNKNGKISGIPVIEEDMIYEISFKSNDSLILHSIIHIHSILFVFIK